MILKALNRYYVSEKSERDNKPCLIFKNVLLGFAGCCFFQKLPPEGRTTTWNLCFFQKLPPEGRINHETYVFFFKNPSRGPTKPWNLYFSKNPYIHTIHTCNAYNTYMQYIYNAYLHWVQKSNIWHWYRNSIEEVG